MPVIPSRYRGASDQASPDAGRDAVAGEWGVGDAAQSTLPAAQAARILAREPRVAGVPDGISAEGPSGADGGQPDPQRWRVDG